MQVTEIIYVDGCIFETKGRMTYPKIVLEEKLNAKLAEVALAGKTVLSISIVTGMGPASTTPVGAFLVIGTN
jgi:hypothetical protein